MSASKTVMIECPSCGRQKDVWLAGTEIRAGTRCGGCGHAWEIDLAEYY